jgi:Cu(I)-responsive transcriptional regulator
MDTMTIGQLAEATGTKVETVRYYEKIGLLPRPRRTAGNYRSYAEEQVQQLAFIRRARNLGFSIEEVRELLRLAAHEDQPCADVDEIAARHLAATKAKIAALTRLRRELGRVLASCEGGSVGQCRVIQALSREDERPKATHSGRHVG